MNAFRIRTFGTKLLFVMLLVSGVAATFVCVSLVTRHAIQIRQSTLDTLESQGDIIRSSSVAALRFDDPDAGNETLAALRAVPAVRGARITRPNGSQFATYLPPDPDFDFSDVDVPVHGHRLSGSTFVLSRPIEHDGDFLGTLQLQYDMRPTYAKMRTDVAVAAVMALAAMALSLLLGLHLKKLLTQPVSELVRVAGGVANHQDYSQRAIHNRDDELGNVMDVFNSMLATIEIRQAELQKARDELELRVQERTAQLEAAKTRAEEANQAKTNFLANMSHEIRTPMTAILGYSEMLQDPDHSPSHRLECIQTIRRNGNHLLGLINDILDISKIEAGRMTVESRPTPLIEMIADVASLMRLRAGEKGLAFRVEYLSPMPEIIQTDPTRLRQVLMNLLANAVKFTKEGAVRLLVEHLPPQDEMKDEHSIRFDVCDTGIGLSQEQIDRLFVPFSQADESVSRKFGGTGLGLAISRQLAQLLGGDISVTSHPGSGSKFSVTVTTGSLHDVRMIERPSEIEAEIHAQVDDSSSESAPIPTLCGRILVAEDGIDNQRLIRGILTAAGADVTLVENGRQACEAIEKSSGADEPFDLIMMDMQMPEMDGYAATRELRKRGYSIPIIALTAHALSGDRERCIDAGCDEYLSKPIDRRRLVETAGRFMTTGEPMPVAAAGALSPDATVASEQPKKQQRETTNQAILKSEFSDDPTMAELIGEFLSALPERIYEIERASSEQDMKTLAVLSHKLKGAGGGYGYTPITETSRTLEHLARDGSDLKAIRDTVHELKELCERARACNPQVNTPGEE